MYKVPSPTDPPPDKLIMYVNVDVLAEESRECRRAYYITLLYDARVVHKQSGALGGPYDRMPLAAVTYRVSVCVYVCTKCIARVDESAAAFSRVHNRPAEPFPRARRAKIGCLKAIVFEPEVIVPPKRHPLPVRSSSAAACVFRPFRRGV